VLVKLAYAYSVELDAITLMTLRMLFALPFFLVVTLWLQRQAHIPSPTRRELGLIAVLGVLGFYLASLLDFSGLACIPAGLEHLILFLYPTLVVLFSALFYRKPVTIGDGSGWHPHDARARRTSGCRRAALSVMRPRR